MDAVACDVDHFEIDQQLFDLRAVEQPSTMEAGVSTEDLGVEMNRGVPDSVRQDLSDSPTAARSH